MDLFAYSPVEKKKEPKGIQQIAKLRGCPPRAPSYLIIVRSYSCGLLTQSLARSIFLSYIYIQDSRGEGPREGACSALQHEHDEAIVCTASFQPSCSHSCSCFFVLSSVFRRQAHRVAAGSRSQRQRTRPVVRVPLPASEQAARGQFVLTLIHITKNMFNFHSVVGTSAPEP
jgi:hypothetical protein